MRLRRTLRRWRFAAIDWLYEREPAEMFVFGLFVVAAMVAIVVRFFVMSPTSTVGSAPPLDIRNGSEGSRSEPAVRFLNQAGGYHFAYPEAWDLSQEGKLSQLESPNGNIVLSFGVTLDDNLARATTHLVRRLAGPPREEKVIGTSRERIAGSPAFMRGGMTRDETGTSIRYLAIAIDGDDRTYTISITVPAHVDPENVLSTVESIVTSFGTTQPDLISS